jgi:SAM-dependent methyltransferase
LFNKPWSLIRFYLQCISAYFRPGATWSVRTPFNLGLRILYWFCNWCYFCFLNTAEVLAFAGQASLRAQDRALYRRYRFPNQFWIALTEGLKVERPETLYRLTYGETSWFGIRSALKAVNATAEDVFYDLGCGTGRNVFFARIAYGMQAVGIDLLPTFVNHAKAVVQELNLNNIAFYEQDAFQTDVSTATIVYVTANCFDQECLDKLYQTLAALPVGARVISTARPLATPVLRLTGSQRQFFSWGLDQVFYHERI